VKLIGESYCFTYYHFIALLSHLFKPVIIYNGSEVTSNFSSLYKETEEGLRFQKSIHASDIVIRSSTRLLAILDGKGLLDLQ